MHSAASAGRKPVVDQQQDDLPVKLIEEPDCLMYAATLEVADDWHWRSGQPLVL